MTEAALLHEPAHQPDPRVSYVVARLERALRAEINERVKPHGLTTLQYTTLSILERGGELSNAQLARRAYMTPQSMSEVLDALEKKGSSSGRRTPTIGACSRPRSRPRAVRCSGPATSPSTSSSGRCSASYRPTR